MAKTYCVTGANGFTAQHVIVRLLNMGHFVQGTVRDAKDEKRLAFLNDLPGAKERLKLFSVNLEDENEAAFEAAVAGCEGVFMIASPLGWRPQEQEDSAKNVLGAAVEGCLRIMRACKKAGVKTVILTSSGSACFHNKPGEEPRPGMSEDVFGDEQFWLDAKLPYFASKTMQEKAAWKWVKDEGEPFRFIVIMPEVILGHSFGPELPATMQAFVLRILDPITCGPDAYGKNGGVGHVNVEDTANMHIAAMMNPAAKGRYFSNSGWIHADEMLADLQDLCRTMHIDCPILFAKQPYSGTEPKMSYQFDRTRMDTLGVTHRPLKEVFRSGLEDLLRKGELTPAKIGMKAEASA